MIEFDSLTKNFDKVWNFRLSLHKYRPKQLIGYLLCDPTGVNLITEMTSIRKLAVYLECKTLLDLSPLSALVQLTDVRLLNCHNVCLPQWAASLRRLYITEGYSLSSLYNLARSEAQLLEITIHEVRDKEALSLATELTSEIVEEFTLIHYILLKQAPFLTELRWPRAFDVWPYQFVADFAPLFTQLHTIVWNIVPSSIVMDDDGEEKERLPPLGFPMLTTCAMNNDPTMEMYRIESMAKISYIWGEGAGGGGFVNLEDLVSRKWIAPKLTSLNLWWRDGEPPFTPLDMSFSTCKHALHSLVLDRCGAKTLGAPITHLPADLTRLVLLSHTISPSQLPKMNAKVVTLLFNAEMICLHSSSSSFSSEAASVIESSIPSTDLLMAFPSLTMLSYNVGHHSNMIPPHPSSLSKLKVLHLFYSPRQEETQERKYPYQPSEQTLYADKQWIVKHLETMVRELPTLESLCVDERLISNEMKEVLQSIMKKNNPHNTFSTTPSSTIWELV